MPNLYDFPAPLSGVNQGLQNLQQGLMQTQQMRGMQQEMQGQGMRNRLYQMELGQKQQDITRQEELERRLKGLPDTATGKDIEQAYSGASPVKGAEMRINKEQERLKIKVGFHKDTLDKMIGRGDYDQANQYLEAISKDPDIKSFLGVNGIESIKFSPQGSIVTQIKDFPANAINPGSDAGRYKVKKMKGKPDEYEMLEKKIDKTIDLGDKVRIVYTDGTTKDEKKGVSPSVESKTFNQAKSRIEQITKMAGKSTGNSLLTALNFEDLQKAPDRMAEVSEWLNKNPQFREAWNNSWLELGVDLTKPSASGANANSDWKKYLK